MGHLTGTSRRAAVIAAMAVTLLLAGCTPTLGSDNGAVSDQTDDTASTPDVALAPYSGQPTEREQAGGAAIASTFGIEVSPDEWHQIVASNCSQLADAKGSTLYLPSTGANLPTDTREQLANESLALTLFVRCPDTIAGGRTWPERVRGALWGLMVADSEARKSGVTDSFTSTYQAAKLHPPTGDWGTECADGTLSESTGSGTCAWHGGEQ